jgi:hypothetical protein
MFGELSLWGVIERAGIQVAPYQDSEHGIGDPKRGYCWRISGVRGWSDSFPTREEALAGAITWLIQTAKAFRAVDTAAGEGDAELFALWVTLLQRAGV